MQNSNDHVSKVGVLLLAFVTYKYSMKTGRPWKAVSSNVTTKAYLDEAQYLRTCDLTCKDSHIIFPYH